MSNWWTDWNIFNTAPPASWPIPAQISVNDTAAILNVSAATVGSMAADGRLAGIYNDDGSLCAIYGVSLQSLLATWPNPSPPPYVQNGG